MCKCKRNEVIFYFYFFKFGKYISHKSLFISVLLYCLLNRYFYNLHDILYISGTFFNVIFLNILIYFLLQLNSFIRCQFCNNFYLLKFVFFQQLITLSLIFPLKFTTNGKKLKHKLQLKKRN